MCIMTSYTQLVKGNEVTSLKNVKKNNFTSLPLGEVDIVFPPDTTAPYSEVT